MYTLPIVIQPIVYENIWIHSISKEPLMNERSQELQYPVMVRVIALFQRRANDGLTASERRYLAQEYTRKVGYMPSDGSYKISVTTP